MTTLSNLNMVVQQGGGVREAVSDRNQPQNIGQAAAEQLQLKKDEEQRTTVQNAQEDDRITNDEEKDAKQKMEYQARERKKKEKKDKEAAKSNPDGLGRLINTVG